MTDTSMTIRERVAEAIEREHVDYKPTPADYLRMADAAIAIVVEVFRNGQSSLLDEEGMTKCQTSETPSGSSTAP